MKIFIVEYTATAVVMAETADEAKEIALDDDSWIETLPDRDEISAHDSSGCLPGDWSEGCLIYHAGEDDITVAEALAMCGAEGGAS